MNIVTWDMQGASHSTENKWNAGVLNLINRFDADICCLQECGAVPDSAQLSDKNYCDVPNLMYYKWGTERMQYHILFYPADANGNRCNLAIVSKMAPQAGSIIYPTAPPVWRPALGFQVNRNNTVFSVHAISPKGPDATKLLAAIDSKSGEGQYWFAAGDYNREPETLVIPFVICPPNLNTYPVNYPERKIDYCVKNTGDVVTGSVLSLVMSDHYPVFFRV